MQLIEHHIRVTDERPFEHKMRRIYEAILGEARRTVAKWSEDGVIEPSASKYSTAPVLVKNSDDTYCMCIDYRTVNERTVKDAYPVGSRDGILEELRGAKYISKIDLKNAYLQVPMPQQARSTPPSRCQRLDYTTSEVCPSG